mgnify:CR=1 FL=1
MYNLLKLSRVYKAFKVGSRFNVVLKNINMAVDKGEMVAILGKSGSGKTTLLNLIAGLDRPSWGHIYFNGVDLVYLSEDELSILRRRIGFIFQDYNLISCLTALENILLAMEIAGSYKRENRRDVAYKLLEMMGVAHVANRVPIDLSGGEKQRVAIARALAKKPLIVLADEPTGALDTRTGKQIVDLMVKVNESFKTAFIVVTHDVEVAERMRRRVLIRDGCLVDCS